MSVPPRSSYRLAKGKTLTVTPGIGVVFVRATDGGISGVITVATTYGPYMVEREFTVDGDATAVLADDTLGMAGRGIAPNSFNSAAGNIATRIVSGRMETVTTMASTTTFELLLAVAAPFDAVRLVLAAGYDATATTPSGVILGAAAVPTTVPADINAATWVQDGTTVTLPPGTAATRRAFRFSNWLRVASVPRTDGGTLPLVCLRAYFPTGTIVTSGAAAGADSFTNWATHASGRIFRMRQQTVNGVGTPTDFVTVTDRSTSPIVGVQYISRGKVYSIAGFGDSITEGRGTYLNEGWGFPAAVQLSTDFGIPFEWSDMAWSGVSYPRIADHVADAITTAGLRFDAAFLPVATPNSLSTTIVDADITTNRTYRAQAVAALAAAGVPILPWTVLPVNPVVKDFGSSDSKRTAYNAEWRALVSKGVVLADFDSKLAGVTDGDGQVNLLVGATADGIHPNDTGNALLSPLAVNAVKRILSPEAGTLITA